MVDPAGPRSVTMVPSINVSMRVWGNAAVTTAIATSRWGSTSTRPRGHSSTKQTMPTGRQVSMCLEAKSGRVNVPASTKDRTCPCEAQSRIGQGQVGTKGCVSEYMLLEKESMPTRVCAITKFPPPPTHTHTT